MFGLLLCASLSTRPAVKEDGETACNVCNIIVTAIEQAMKTTTVASEIEQLLIPLCSSLKQPLSATCEVLVRYSVPQIMKWLEEKLSHAQICQKLKLCTEKPAVKSVNDDECQFCLLVVSSLITYLGDSSNVQEIKDFLNAQLAKFPIQIQMYIKPYIDTYFDIGVQYIIYYLQMGNPCKEQGFCP